MFDHFDTTLFGLELEALTTRPEAYTPDPERPEAPQARQRQFRNYVATSPRQPPLRGARRACACLTAEEHLSECRGRARTSRPSASARR
jgi:hypothetical protein